VLVVTVIIGVFFSAILIIHTFITGNAIEKNSLDLKTTLEKYYNKEAEVLKEEAEALRKEKEALKAAKKEE